MKKSNDLDVVCLEKILKHIQTISDAYATFKINNATDLADNHICQLAITQAITNVYELRKRIQDSTLVNVPKFSRLKLGLKVARNIASHDYDSLDFGIVFKITNRLIDSQLVIELEAAKNGVKCDCTSN